uniref:Spectrin beta, non-erythrocytic 4 n=1 Tax=Leptobrachium leishanense TaxID=445787 RepID=A0A8C5MN46_9ANUR
LEKTLMARDNSRDLAQRAHKKWLKHQAFMAELSQNKGWLDKIEKEGNQLIQEKPELAGVVKKKIEEIRQCWVELESSTQAKAQQLFHCNKADLVVQNYSDLGKRLHRLQEQLQPAEHVQDVSSVNTQLKKLESMESQMEEWYKEMGVLQAQIASLPLDVSSQEAVEEKQNEVGTRIVRLIEPLKERRRILLASKEVHQVTRDLEDEITWVQERLPLATSKEHGSNLQTVQQLTKKNQNLRREIQVHSSRVDDLLERAGAIASIRTPEAEGVRIGYENLREMWDLLREEAERRQQLLDISYQVQQYYFDVGEVETWLSEQELLMMNDEKGKDEQSTLQLLKKHLMLEQTIENYEETIAQLSRQCRSLLDLGHPNSEQISKRQSQVDRLYVSLKDLVEERKVRLEQQYWLFQLSREVDELEQWIAEKEVVAGSPELGQDYEHVTLLQEKFTEFANETGSIGHERISAVNQMVDELIDYGHADAATIAEWKDGVNEAWADLLELMETRSQMLSASHELHKFFNDCKEVLSQVEEKKQRLPELKAQEGKLSAGCLQRILSSFEHDIQVLVTQVRQLQENAAQLRTVYAGENAAAIVTSEQEVMRSWKELLAACEDCRLQITTTTDRMKFLSLVKDLISWMDSIINQIGTGEKPRDVSSVEVLMSYHQGLKSEIETRNKRIVDCVELGKTLVLNNRPASDEIKQSLDRLMAKKKELLEKWDKHWEWMQQMLEVHQFAQEAGVAEAWLTAQEPIVKSPELGNSVDEVEQLIRRHEAFRKTAAAWEERFSSLRRLTTLEKMKAEQNKQPPTPLLGRRVFPDTTDFSGRASPLARQGLHERSEPKAEQKDTLSVPNGSQPDGHRTRGGDARVGYVRQDVKPERLQPRVDHVETKVSEKSASVQEGHRAERSETKVAQGMATLSVEKAEGKTSRHPERRRDRHERRLERQESSEHETPKQEPADRRRDRHEKRVERQGSSEQEPPKPEQPERRRDRHEKKLERQGSSEQEPPKPEQPERRRERHERRMERQESIEKEATKIEPDKQGGKESPARLPNGVEKLPERTPRPDRPRARDRPKPRRRPRPKDPNQPPGEARRSRSAPAQSSAPPPPPPSHTVQQEGYLFRKHELDGPSKKASNRSWVNLYCVLNKGDLGVYKDAKSQSSGATHGGEPLLNLHGANCEVANEYKKKKSRESPGFGFVLSFKFMFFDAEFLVSPQEEMKNWITAITTSVSEHSEISKWSQTLLTTSSTDEGNIKRESDRRSSAGGRKK